MNRKKITTIAACLIMALSLTACGSQTSQPGQEGQSSQPAQNTQTADSGSVTEQNLLDEENKILSENQELWEKVFGAMDKNVTDSDLSKNYGEFLLDAIEKAKDQFTDEEYETLHAGAEKIRDIENQIAQLRRAIQHRIQHRIQLRKTLFRNLTDTILTETRLTAACFLKMNLRS